MSVQSDRDKGCSSGSLTDSDFSDKSRQGEVEWGEGGEERGGEGRGGEGRGAEGGERGGCENISVAVFFSYFQSNDLSTGRQCAP